MALLIIEPPQVCSSVFNLKDFSVASLDLPDLISFQVIFDYPSISEVHLICNLTTLGVVAPLGYNGLLILSCTFYAFKVLLFFFLCTLILL